MDTKDYIVKDVISSYRETIDNDNHDQNGIGTGVAALFLLGAMAGAGILAIPDAFQKAGKNKLFIVQSCPN